MERAVTIEDARKKLGDLVEGARLRGDQYIISKKGETRRCDCAAGNCQET